MAKNFIEIPTGKRTPQYRFFEMLPAFLSYGAIILLIVLSIFAPLLAAIYLLLFVFTLLVKAVVVAFQVTTASRILIAARKVDWRGRLDNLENPEKSLAAIAPNKTWNSALHHENMARIVAETSRGAAKYPKPSDLYHAVIVATYNEGYEILEPTIQSLLASDYDPKRMIVAIAYEARGGAATERTVMQLSHRYGNKFKAFLTFKHPENIPHEVIGKGGNITFAGKELAKYLDVEKIAYKNVIVTTLDADNRPHEGYFSYVAYEFIVNPYRKNRSYQPIAVYFNNIWDAPAPMRVIATGNSFWNITVSMRPHALRNFASHSQPMDALAEMDFWSTRTVVEDGHQYWRSYFHFKGDYSVVPIHVPIDQDAVLAATYWKTLKAQFIQLRRWAYGASDVPYVAVQLFTKRRVVPFWNSLGQLIRLIDSHLTWAISAFIVTFGAWVPLILNQYSSRSIVAHELPDFISFLQKIASVVLFVSVFWAFKLLPPRPARYKRHRSFFMIAQWVLMPVTSIVYNASAAIVSQTRLLFGHYLEKFDVTDKAVRIQHRKKWYRKELEE